jgi:predicted nucleic acid-binding protein
MDAALQDGSLKISAVTLLQFSEMSRLGRLTDDARRRIYERLVDVPVEPIDTNVIRRLPNIPDGIAFADRIVAATGLVTNTIVVTANVGLKMVDRLHVILSPAGTFEVRVVASDS